MNHWQRLLEKSPPAEPAVFVAYHELCNGERIPELLDEAPDIRIYVLPDASFANGMPEPFADATDTRGAMPKLAMERAQKLAGLLVRDDLMVGFVFVFRLLLGLIHCVRRYFKGEATHKQVRAVLACMRAFKINRGLLDMNLRAACDSVEAPRELLKKLRVETAGRASTAPSALILAEAIAYCCC
jgi:hypothetical protein